MFLLPISLFTVVGFDWSVKMDWASKSCLKNVKSVDKNFLKTLHKWQRYNTLHEHSKSVLVENRPLVKFIQNYIRDSSGYR